MNLTIDIGNTRSKLAVFDNNKIIDIIIEDQFSESIVKRTLAKYSIKQAILSSVRNLHQDIYSFFNNNLEHFIEFDENTQIPIENLYKTKTTLGKDRLIAIIGANNIYPENNVLVIDMGTAITYDLVNSNNQYLGGTISPGLEMRFKALNHFTDKLPLLSKSNHFKIISDNTDEAIISGVQNGIIFEIDNYITNLKDKFNDLKLILTGGDAIFFDKKLKNTIFVNLNLNFIGLNQVLEHNKAK